MDALNKAKKRHYWSNRSPADAYECGFEDGAHWAYRRAVEFLNADSLFLAIGHGDKEHQEWLKKELKSWFETKHHLASEGTHYANVELRHNP